MQRPGWGLLVTLALVGCEGSSPAADGTSPAGGASSGGALSNGGGTASGAAASASGASAGTSSGGAPAGGAASAGSTAGGRASGGTVPSGGSGGAGTTLPEGVEVLLDPYGNCPLAAVVNVAEIDREEVQSIVVTVSGKDGAEDFERSYTPEARESEAWLDTSDLTFSEPGVHVPVLGLYADSVSHVRIQS